MKDPEGGRASLRLNTALAARLVSLAGVAQCQKAPSDLTEASLEDLLNIEVTTVSAAVRIKPQVNPHPGVTGNYARVDARLGYRLRTDVDISFAGQNLQGGRHAEFVSVGPYTRATLGRSFFVKLTWGF